MQPNNPILSLRVARFNDEPVAEPMTTEFGAAGGTIGRAAECTLVLPDQQRAISRVHARIEYRAGDYLLCDLGSNPSVLNQRALGGTREARLAHGDRLLIGAYLLEVMIGEHGEALGDMTGGRDPLASAKLLGGAPFSEGLDRSFGGDALDPLGQPALGAPPRISSRPGFNGSESDHVSPEWQAFSVPVPAAPAPAAGGAARPAGGIPADYDPLADALAQWENPAHAEPMPAALAPRHAASDVSSLLAAPPVSPGVGLAPPGGPTGLPASLLDSPIAGGATPFDDLFAAVPATPPSAPALGAAMAFSAASGSAPASASPAPRGARTPSFETTDAAPLQAQWASGVRTAASPAAARATPVPVNAAAAQDTPLAEPDSTVMAALIEGLGIDAARAPNLPPLAFARLIGVMLRTSLRGTMAVLRSRSMTKREARLDTTVIVERDNNPLKFFPDVDTALLQMLTGRSAGYLPPAEALDRAFDDIEAHELAVLAGMRAALAAVLGRFDPALIEAQVKEQGVLDKVLSNRKARLWDHFVELQGAIAREADDDFQKLFGKAFNDAYEAQIEALWRARKAGKTDPADNNSLT